MFEIKPLGKSLQPVCHEKHTYSSSLGLYKIFSASENSRLAQTDKYLREGTPRKKCMGGVRQQIAYKKILEQ